MTTPQVDWDSVVTAVSTLRMSVEGNLIYWNGTFSVLMRFIQVLQQSKLELAMARLGWLVTVQFLEFANPVQGRIMILPRVGVPFADIDFFMTFLKATLVVLALPRGIPEVRDAVYTKIKIWGHPAFKGWLPAGLLVGKLHDAWSIADTMMGDSTNIRAVCHTGTMNPSFRLVDYAIRDPEDFLKITVHFVLGLRGGGGTSIPDHASLVKQKNELAAFCLGQGGELQHVTSFVDKISKGSSPATIEAVLSPKSAKDKLEAISKLAKTLNIPIPDFSAPNLRRRDKIRDRVNLPAKEVAANIDLSGIRIKEGFFRNEDQSACQQTLKSLLKLRVYACSTVLSQLLGLLFDPTCLRTSWLLL